MRPKPARPFVIESSNELRQKAACIDPGTILFLRKDEEAQKYLPYTSLHRRALGHPCVVVDVAQDESSAMILTMTTFARTLMVDYLQREYWQDYLPIAPTPCNPVFPGIQLHPDRASSPLVGGYVNIVDRHLVPWDMLRKWQIYKPIGYAHLAEESVDLIFYFLEWATYDPTGEVSFPKDYKTVPCHLRKNRYRPLANGKQGVISRQQVEIDALAHLAARGLKRPFEQTSFDNLDFAAQTDSASELSSSDNGYSDYQLVASENHFSETERQLRFQQKLNMLLLWVVIGILLLIVHPAILRKIIASD